MSELLRPTPWDTVPLGMPTWELSEYSAAALQQAVETPGHHTIKVDPLADKRLLHEHGFYYCDTLIEPHCPPARLRPASHPDATIAPNPDVVRTLALNHGAYAHGRFSRDFNLSREAADLRYDTWIRQLLEKHQVYGLYWQDGLGGFIGYDGGNLLLHAVGSEYRGKGYAKYWWSAVCETLFAAGCDEVRSSISAGNLAVLNLYSSLGFSFRNPQDIYHRLTT